MKTTPRLISPDFHSTYPLEILSWETEFCEDCKGWPEFLELERQREEFDDVEVDDDVEGLPHGKKTTKECTVGNIQTHAVSREVNPEGRGKRGLVEDIGGDGDGSLNPAHAIDSAPKANDQREIRNEISEEIGCDGFYDGFRRSKAGILECLGAEERANPHRGFPFDYFTLKGNAAAANIQLAYCVVAVEAAGRQVPIAFLERVKDDFNKRYGGGKAATAVANSLNKEFGPTLREHMQYCVDHPEEISKLAKVKAQVSEVKGVMMENIEKVLDRGEKIELLVDKTENLRSQAQDFRQQGTKMRRKMWLQNMKIKLIVLGILIALILIIVLSVCHGFNC
ncbi:hypothetical protein HHK36_022385 [Tetracentron sinense]|uniref:Uncharacterized protein n=1 Tax=Tetracentron sinense TaxID=13715 RepID=A0A834YPR8_TETSI|nr:hypothetical protein HHK36_022385 [Tetracentron sinense]